MQTREAVLEVENLQKYYPVKKGLLLQREDVYKRQAGVLCGDVLKGTCAVLLGKLFFSLLAPGAGVIYGAYLAAIAAVLGHLFPLYFGFKGGKGISVATGAVLAIEPPIILALVVVFLAMVICTRCV